MSGNVTTVHSGENSPNLKESADEEGPTRCHRAIDADDERERRRARHPRQESPRDVVQHGQGQGGGESTGATDARSIPPRAGPRARVTSGWRSSRTATTVRSSAARPSRAGLTFTTSTRRTSTKNTPSHIAAAEGGTRGSESARAYS